MLGTNSVFSGGIDEISNLIRDAHGQPANVQSTSGNLQITVAADHIVGLDKVTGMATNVYTVIVSPSGNLITAFPGVP